MFHGRLLKKNVYFWLHISCFELSSEVMGCVCVCGVVGAVLWVSVQGIA